MGCTETNASRGSPGGGHREKVRQPGLKRHSGRSITQTGLIPGPFTTRGKPLRNLFFSFVMFLICGLSFVASLHAACIIDDEEEYAVFAAVLFPNEPDVPDRMTNDLERRAYLASAHRPSGAAFMGARTRFRTRRREARVTGALDQFMDKDFNTKNGQACRIEAARFLAHMPGREAR